MRASILALAAVPALGQVFNGQPVQHEKARPPHQVKGQDDQQGEGILRLPIKPSKPSKVTAAGKDKRQAIPTDLPRGLVENLPIYNHDMGDEYTVVVEIGLDNPTAVELRFDFRTWDTWVNPDCSTVSDPETCGKQNFFDGSDSVEYLDYGRSHDYGWGRVDFMWANDYIHIGVGMLPQQYFGIANHSQGAEFGSLGMVPNASGFNASYLLLDSLVTGGFIRSRAFSLDLRGWESQHGSVIYGGIDAGKFSGSLEKLPIIPGAEAPDGKTRYWVYLDGLTVPGEDGTQTPIFSEDDRQPVRFDLFAISLLPLPIFQKILAAYPSATKTSWDDRLYEVDCNVGGTFDFTFGKATINVPASEFLYRSGESCILGFMELENGVPILGSNFLRGAYAVFDWDNEAIHLANNGNCGDRLLPIGTGTDSVPSETGMCAPQATSTSTTAEATSTSTSTSTSSEEATSSSTITAPETTSTGTGTGTSSEEATSSSTITAPETTSTGTGTSTSSEEATSSSTITAPETTSTGTGTSTSSEEATSSTITAPETTSTSTSTSSEEATETPSTGASYTETSSSSTLSTGVESGTITSSGSTTVTSPVYSTTIHTITSCPPVVTDCPIGKVTTEIITSYTTWCPEEGDEDKTSEASTPTGGSSSVFSTTVTRTGDNDELITETFLTTTWVDIQTTESFTRTTTFTDENGEVQTSSIAVVVTPIIPEPSPEQNPGSSDDSDVIATVIAVVTPTPKYPETNIATKTRGQMGTGTGAPVPKDTNPPVTAGAADFPASGSLAVFIGALIAAAF